MGSCNVDILQTAFSQNYSNVKQQARVCLIVNLRHIYEGTVCLTKQNNVWARPQFLSRPDAQVLQ